MADLQTFLHRNEVGQIKPWGKSTAPTGYVLCNGAAISRTDYADLYGVIGTTYGTGDGSSTFNVPNLAGKMPQGYDGNTYNMAGTGGANTVTVAVTNNQAATSTSTQAVSITGSIDNTSLTAAQTASHTHEMVVGWTEQGGGTSSAFCYGEGMGNVQSRAACNAAKLVPQSWTDGNVVCNSGSGTGHNHAHTLSGTLTGSVSTNLTGAVTASGTNSFSPYVVVNYIIKH